MIEVKNLVKKYGNHTAVDHLNFTIEEGHVYGFLGPNGAGKSTTMNIMTGYLGATEGEVLINGHDILKEPEEAKKQIGYLPELPPLYMEMTVREYLEFVAELKGIAKKKREESRNELFGGSSSSGLGPNPFTSNPFGMPSAGGSIPSNPFGGPASNPFNSGMPSPFGQSSPVTNTSNTPSNDIKFDNPFSNSNVSNGSDDLDIDEIVKKIDAKIAELEEEEKKNNIAIENEEKELSKVVAETTKDESKKEDSHDIMDDYFEDLSFDEPQKIEEKKEVKEEPPVLDNEPKNEVYKNKQEIDKIMNEKNNTSDDDDDFFDEIFE